MRSYLILPAVLGVALSAPAMADQFDHVFLQPTAPSRDCTYLKKVFDRSITTHRTAAEAAAAAKLRNKAGILCAGGDYSAGVTDLNFALKDLNIYTVL